MPKPRFLCAPAFGRSWWWRFGGGWLCFRGASVVVMWCAVMWYVMLCGWLRGEMQYCGWLSGDVRWGKVVSREMSCQVMSCSVMSWDVTKYRPSHAKWHPDIAKCYCTTATKITVIISSHIWNVTCTVQSNRAHSQTLPNIALAPKNGIPRYEWNLETNMMRTRTCHLRRGNF